MLKAAKLTALRAARCVGGYAALRGSRWRRERLLILCYHGISLADEHCWNPELYIPGNLFEQRLAAIREQGYNVLPLDDALDRLYAGELPRSRFASLSTMVSMILQPSPTRCSRSMRFRPRCT